MHGPNYKIVEFFFSSYRLEDIQLRINLVSPNFQFSSPLVSCIGFDSYHKIITIMRNNTRREIVNIHTTDDVNFKVDMNYHIVDNSINYVKDMDVVMTVSFDGNLIEILNMDYELTPLDKKVFQDIKIQQG